MTDGRASDSGWGRGAAGFSVLFAGLAVLASLLGGCERQGSESAATQSASQSPARSASREGEARAGGASDSPTVVTSDRLPEAPQRIVSLAPNVTEILFALGAGDRVAAVTNFCDYPKAVDKLPTVGTFSNPDFEMILAQKPDLVVGVISGGDKSVVDKLESAGVPYAFVRIYTVEETLKGIRQVGRWIGRGEAAERLVGRLRHRLATVAQRYADRPAPEVLLVYGHDPLVAAGPGTFGHQLITRAGGKNVVGDTDNKFPRLDLEKVLELQPDRILDTSMVPGAQAREFWARHTGLKAVQSGGVVHLDDPVVMRPGPRIDEAFERIARAVHGASAAEDSESSDGSDGGRP